MGWIMKVREALSPLAGSKTRYVPAREAKLKELLAGACNPLIACFLLKRSATQLVGRAEGNAWAS